MKEVALVFDKNGKVIHWMDGTSGAAIPDSQELWEIIWKNREIIAAIPDSQELWEIIWKNREIIGGVAHTHPWDGPTGPSGTDLTTFAVLERALNLSLVWPIITMTHEVYFSLCSDDSAYLELSPPSFASRPWWKDNIEELRRRSRGA